ncbi:hypothetical protein JA1_000392 [Spathaspora sp. JA1]|nr:hypothetical protein JA1_000392 [Spathaspora sp. JA1]
MSINPNFSAFRVVSNNNNLNNTSSENDSNNDENKDSNTGIKNKKGHLKRMNSRKVASNSPQLSKRPAYATYDTTSSILSDYDDLEFVEDEESSYVLFNPVQSKRNESDILSLTNTTTNAYSTDIDEDDEEDDSEHEVDSPIRDNGDLGSTTELYKSTQEYLSNKINSWYNSNNALLDNQLLVSDNVASWNLDEAVMDQSVAWDDTDKSDPNEKSILKAFYGDELFKYLNPEEIARVKKFHKLTDIKNYLLDKENESSSYSNSLLNQILYKLLLLNKNSDYEDDSIETNTQQETNLSSVRLSGTIDYVNHLRRSRNRVIPPPVEVGAFSETTNGSSLIMCGGETTSSWNEI